MRMGGGGSAGGEERSHVPQVDQHVGREEEGEAAAEAGGHQQGGKEGDG